MIKVPKKKLNEKLNKISLLYNKHMVWNCEFNMLRIAAALQIDHLLVLKKKQMDHLLVN